MTFDEWYQKHGIDVAKAQGVWTMGGMTLALSAWDASRREALEEGLLIVRKWLEMIEKDICALKEKA